MTDFFDRNGQTRRLFGLPGWDDDIDLELDDDYRNLPRPAPGLLPVQTTSLAAAVETGLQERGCDGSLRAAEAWAVREGVDRAKLSARLRDRGGYCDCEVLLNALEPD